MPQEGTLPTDPGHPPRMLAVAAAGLRFAGPNWPAPASPKRGSPSLKPWHQDASWPQRGSCPQEAGSRHLARSTALGFTETRQLPSTKQRRLPLLWEKQRPREKPKPCWVPWVYSEDRVRVQVQAGHNPFQEAWLACPYPTCLLWKMHKN